MNFGYVWHKLNKWTKNWFSSQCEGWANLLERPREKSFAQTFLSCLLHNLMLFQSLRVGVPGVGKLAPRCFRVSLSGKITFGFLRFSSWLHSGILELELSSFLNAIKEFANMLLTLESSRKVVEERCQRASRGGENGLEQNREMHDYTLDAMNIAEESKVKMAWELRSRVATVMQNIWLF